MPQPTCTTCPRPVPDTAYGCVDCAVQLAGVMGRLAGIVAELDTTVAQQGQRASDGPRPAGAEIPLPYNVHAAEKAHAIHGELTTWARHVQEQTGRRIQPGHPAAAAAALLAGSMQWMRYRPEWPDGHSALSGLLKDTLRVIDIPPERQYVGPCGYVDPGTEEVCGADVYARPHAAVTICRACETEYDVEACKEWMRDQLMDFLARPVEISAMLLRLGMNLPYRKLARFVESGQVVSHGHDAKNRPLFRIGDVVKLILDDVKPRRASDSSRGVTNLRKG